MSQDDQWFIEGLEFMLNSAIAERDALRAQLTHAREALTTVYASIEFGKTWGAWFRDPGARHPGAVGDRELKALMFAALRAVQPQSSVAGRHSASLAVLTVRCTKLQLEQWEAMAARVGLPFHEWVRAVLDLSEKILTDDFNP